jgi:DNA-binding protein HU-beta
VENCGSAIDCLRQAHINFQPPTEFISAFRSTIFFQPDRKGGLNVNKNDLVNAVSGNSGLSKVDAAKAVDGVFDAISGSLARGQEVRVVGFGTFSVARRKATQGRNPRTGEKIQIAASNQPKFKAGKGLKDAVN